MLLMDELDVLPDAAVELYEKFATSVINEIAAYLVKWLDKNLEIRPAAYMFQRLLESGGSHVFNLLLERVAHLSNISRPTLYKIFKDAGVKSVAFDNKIYKRVGLNPRPLQASEAMLQVLKAGLDKTNKLMKNLTLTTAQTGQDAFIDAADLAYMQVSTGAFDYNTAVKQGVKKLAREGLTVVNYPSGRKDKLDVAVRRAVLTGVSQTAGLLTWNRCMEMGVKHVETSAHIGARNKGDVPENHEMWQGRVFSIDGSDPDYPDFVTVTGYGTGTGLHGWNCRHSFFPFFKGISERLYSEAELSSYANKYVQYEGESISFYEATQIQRGIEREIRKTKREAAALGAAGQDNWEELEEIKQLQAKMRSFISQTGIDRQSVREQIGEKIKKVGTKPKPVPPPPTIRPKNSLKSIEGLKQLVDEGYKEVYSSEVGSGHTNAKKVKFKNGQAAIRKKFYTSSREELAYKLDQMFDLNRVPESYYDSKTNHSYQLWISEGQDGYSIKPGDLDRDEVGLQVFFDILIGNGDRSERNELFLDNGKIVLIDNEWAFKFRFQNTWAWSDRAIREGSGYKASPYVMDHRFYKSLVKYYQDGSILNLAAKYLDQGEQDEMRKRIEYMINNWYDVFEDK